jgi:hypothetical protein
VVSQLLSNQRVQPTPLCGPKIVRILETGLGLIVIPLLNAARLSANPLGSRGALARHFATRGLPMKVLHRSIKWVMLLFGLLTCTMFYAAVAPDASLRSNFGQSIDGPVAQIVVRNWGALIGLVGLLLMYGAFREPARRIALLVAGASKVVFIALVLSLGPQFLQYQVGVAVVVDSLAVLLFATYLITTREKSAA